MFSPKNKATACGMWSTTYIIALIVTIALIALALVFSRKLRAKGVKRVLIGLAIFAISTEIMKMIFVGVTYGVDEVEFIPIYFCSLFIYSLPMSLSKNEQIRNTGLSFLFFGGIVGAAAFFAYPSACIPNYPIYHFMCIRTMLFHGSMIYAGILIVITGFYRPSLAHFRNYSIFIAVATLLALTINNLTGQNLMYLSKALSFSLSKIVFQSAPVLYPLLVMLIEIFLPFALSFGAYKFVKLIKNKCENRKQNLGGRNVHI